MPLAGYCSNRGHGDIHQADIKNAYLTGELEEEDLYMQVPKGLEDETGSKVCKLNKGLYGLKQAGNQENFKWSRILLDW